MDSNEPTQRAQNADAGGNSTAPRGPTIRLEQDDSYLTTFRAQVVEVDEVEGAPWVRLDRSAFYPESGGQLADTGTLNDVQVSDVQIRDGAVWHHIRGVSLRVGQAVVGEIDGERRFRHMQRHTAQHLLSQAFLQVDEAFATASVSLTGPECTLDLAGDPTQAALAQAETVANRVVYANLPITAFEVDEADIEAYPLRRPPKVTGKIRLVKMGDFELSACGGTHLSSTAEAAPIKVLKSERIRGDLTRVTFRAGLEALEDYREKHDVAYGLAVAFSSRVGEVTERVAALRQAERAASHALDETRERLAVELAGRLRSEAARLDTSGASAIAGTAGATTDRTSEGPVVVRHVVDPDDSGLLRPLAKALTDHSGTVALLGARVEGKASVLFARSADLDIDLRPLLREAMERVDGKGGGRPDFVQGGGTRPDGLEDALEWAEEVLVDRG